MTAANIIRSIVGQLFTIGLNVERAQVATEHLESELAEDYRERPDAPQSPVSGIAGLANFALTACGKQLEEAQQVLNRIADDIEAAAAVKQQVGEFCEYTDKELLEFAATSVDVFPMGFKPHLNVSRSADVPAVALTNMRTEARRLVEALDTIHSRRSS